MQQPTDAATATPRPIGADGDLPWVCTESQDGIWHIDEQWRHDIGITFGSIATVWQVGGEENARLIVAAVNERANLIRQRDELRDALKAAVVIAKEAWREWDADNDPRVGKLLIALSGKLKGYRPETDAIHAALARAESRQ